MRQMAAPSAALSRCPTRDLHLGPAVSRARLTFARMIGRWLLQRIAFLLRLKPGTGVAYDKDHAEVWPEMLALLKRSGISDYSIFRRDELLFLYMRLDQDFDTVWDRIEADPVNTRWQQAMSAYFLPVQETRSGERFPFLQEVFYMP